MIYVPRGKAMPMSGTIVLPEQFGIRTSEASVPVIGGRQEVTGRSQEWGEILRMDGYSASTEAGLDQEKSYTTVSQTTLENINVRGVFRAERLHGRLTARTLPTGETMFECRLDLQSLWVKNREVRITIDGQLMGPISLDQLRHRYTHDEPFFRLHGDRFFGSERGILPRPLGDRRILPSTHDRVVYTLVDRIIFRNSYDPSVNIVGHSLHIKDFGVIYFGEVILSKFDQRLILVRFELGSPVVGSLELGELETGAVPLPLPSRDRPAGQSASVAGFVKEVLPREAPLLLLAHHWLEYEQDRAISMGAPLESGRTYWYVFSIGKEAPEASTAVPFNAPSELDERDSATVLVEVHCDLLRGGSERRRARYRRGAGLDPQIFELATRPGSFPLRIVVVHANRPIYSQGWMLTVGDGTSNESPPLDIPVVEPASVSPHVLPDPRRRPFRLIFGDKDGLQLFPPAGRSIHGTSPGRLETPLDAAKARKLLRDFARSVEGSSTVDATAATTFLIDMADWGHQQYLKIFTFENTAVREALEAIPNDSTLTIDTDAPGLPWQWLYIHEPDYSVKPDDPVRWQKFLSGFWGMRWESEIVPLANYNHIDMQWQLANQNRTVLVGAVNIEAYPAIALENRKMIDNLHRPLSVNPVIARTYEGKDGAHKMFHDVGASPALSPHLLYFYGHHSAGRQINEYGYIDDSDSIFYMNGESDGALTITELRRHGYKPSSGRDTLPLVFLNACATAQGQDFGPSGFVPYFIEKWAAPAVLATVAEVPASHAGAFAEAFLKQWFRCTPASAAICAIRRQWLSESCNPFAMYYTLHGIGDVSLQKAL